MARRVIYIGGSPCSGKSTVAERFAKEYGAYYFKVDDYLDDFLERAADRGYPACSYASCMLPEEIWMRTPREQCEHEFAIYTELEEFIRKAIGKIPADLVITEGAAFVPHNLKRVQKRNFLCIIPSPEFQVTHYKQRPWVPYVLDGCSDQDKAFDNWMQRDIQFAQRVKEECQRYGFTCITNDGSLTEDELYAMVAEHFMGE